jgi:hypothetical protein
LTKKKKGFGTKIKDAFKGVFGGKEHHEEKLHEERHQ